MEKDKSLNGTTYRLILMETLLIELEKEGLNLRRQGNVEQAANIFAKIISKQPNYEHRICFYHLACCLEDLGDFEKTEENYLQAIKYVPDDLILFRRIRFLFVFAW